MAYSSITGSNGRPKAIEPLSEIQKDVITIVRSVLRRVMNLADEAKTLDENLRFLDRVSIAGTRISSMIKTEHSMGSKGGFSDQVDQALREAILELGEELGLSK